MSYCFKGFVVRQLTKGLAVLALVGLTSSVASASLTWETPTIENTNGTSFMTGASVADFAFGLQQSSTVYGGETWQQGPSTPLNGQPYAYAPGTDLTATANGISVDYYGANLVVAPGFDPVGGTTLLDTCVAGGTTPPYSLTITGLSASQQYQVQFIVADTRSDSAVVGRTAQMFGLGADSGNNSADIQFAYGTGQFAVFTADVTGVTSLAVNPYAEGSNTSLSWWYGTQVNALRISTPSDVSPAPEPASLTLLASASLAFGGFGLYRRRPAKALPKRVK